MFAIIDDSLQELASEIAFNQINAQKKKKNKVQQSGLSILQKSGPKVVSDTRAHQQSESEEDKDSFGEHEV